MTTACTAPAMHMQAKELHNTVALQMEQIFQKCYCSITIYYQYLLN